ncbi:hypothetical protein BHQ15_17740 [Mycolicibacillus koreensis]|nr:hypothetical protein BHQ15_17740 [Mycolicibacillus koreensis]
MTKNNDELLTVQAVADRFGVTDRTVRRYVASGLIPAARLGKRLIRIRAADVDAVLSPTGGAA